MNENYHPHDRYYILTEKQKNIITDLLERGIDIKTISNLLDMKEILLINQINTYKFPKEVKWNLTYKIEQTLEWTGSIHSNNYEDAVKNLQANINWESIAQEAEIIHTNGRIINARIIK